VIAVEGDKAASSDLQANAEAYRGVLRVVAGRVEDFISRSRESVDAIVVDPPRTGISREAVDAIAGRRAGALSTCHAIRRPWHETHADFSTPVIGLRLCKPSTCSRTRRMWRVSGSSMSSFQLPAQDRFDEERAPFTDLHCDAAITPRKNRSKEKGENQNLLGSRFSC